MCKSRCLSLAVGLVALLGQGLVLSGCGQKGPLTLPAAAQTSAPAPASAASSVGPR